MRNIDKWPGERICNDFCAKKILKGMACTCGAQSWNSCRTAFIKIINSDLSLERCDFDKTKHRLMLITFIGEYMAEYQARIAQDNRFLPSMADIVTKHNNLICKEFKYTSELPSEDDIAKEIYLIEKEKDGIDLSWDDLNEDSVVKYIYRIQAKRIRNLFINKSES